MLSSVATDYYHGLLGIGAVTAIFSVMYAVVLRPLPFPEPDQIVSIWSTREGNDDVVIPRNFDAWRREARSFAKLAALERQGFTLTDGADPIQIAGGKVSADFFSVFGAAPLMGRTFSAEEDQPGRGRVAVLSHRIWQQRFAADWDGKFISIGFLIRSSVSCARRLIFALKASMCGYLSLLKARR